MEYNGISLKPLHTHTHTLLQTHTHTEPNNETLIIGIISLFNSTFAIMGQTDHRAGRRTVHSLAAGEEQSPEAQSFWSRAKSVKKKRGFSLQYSPPANGDEELPECDFEVEQI